MKIDLRLTAITILLVGVLYLAVDFNSQINNFHHNYMHTIKKLYTLDNSWKNHLDILKESLIVGNFNNDSFVEFNKKSRNFNKKVLEDTIIKNNYSKIYKILEKYTEERVGVKDLTNQFIMTNAKIKNSLAILNKKMSSLDNEDKIYFYNYIKIVTELNDMKNSFDQQYHLSDGLLEFFKRNQDKNKIYKLHYSHINLLYKEIPRLHKIFIRIKNNNLPKIIQESFQILKIESQKQQKAMENKFYIMIAAYLLFFVTILILVRDIKSRIEQLRLKDKVLYEQAKMASMGEMIDAIAHQWKQPIGLIRINTDFLTYELVDDKLSGKVLEEYQQKIYAQIQHMTNTLDEFRTFLRPNKEKEEFYIEDSIRSVLLLIKDELMQYAIEVKLEVKENLLFHGVENEFKHVILNILNNAKDAFVENKIKDKKIIITLDKVDNKNCITILDNAGGIPKNVIAHIFEANFTTKAEGVGTGIGLYMSKQIIDKSAGTIKVTNQNEGACFTILL